MEVESQMEKFVPIETLLPMAPHKPPMVWMDGLSRVEKSFVEGTLKIRPSGLYCTDGFMRPTALVEVAGQTCLFWRLQLAVYGWVPDEALKRQAFMVGSKDTVFSVTRGDPRLLPGRQVKSQITGYRELGPFSIFDSQVLSDDGSQLVRTQMRVYSQ